MNNLSSFQKRILAKFMGKRVAFFGLGVSNFSAVYWMLKYIPEAHIACYDKKIFPISNENIIKLKNDGVDLHFGIKNFENVEADIIFRTPGMNFFSEVFSGFKKRNIVITSEMELFFELCPCKIIGVTGSDGKTTTTTIISEILKASNKKVYIGGNIGTPLLPRVFDMDSDNYVVVELSSFQLMSMTKSPDISVITNISPNHLDIHKDMDEYVESKKNIFLHQNSFGKVILNFDNEISREFSRQVRGKLEFFSTKYPIENGVCIRKNQIVVMKNGNLLKKIFFKDKIKLPGEHNLENYLSAIAAVYEDVSNDSILNVAENFSGVEHRIEFVRKINGVSFYNDSIASSPTRTIRGTLSVFGQKIILIAGGYDKNLPFEELAKNILKKVKILVLIGETAKKIKEIVLSFVEYADSELKIFIEENMFEAVRVASLNAKSGDIVVLSPACASFDQYKNFEERGKDFKNIVNAL